MEEPTDIGSGDASGTAEGGGAPENQGPGANTRTLAEADADARKFQGMYDKLASKWKPLEQYEALGGPQEIARLVNDVLDLARRPDFNDYRSGRLKYVEDRDPDDEMLSDEQREIRDLKRQVDDLKQGGQIQGAKTQGELAALRFERAEQELKQKYGAAWTTQRDKVLREIQQFTARGLVPNLDAITPALLHKCWAASFDSPEEFEAATTKWVLDNEARRRGEINKGATTTPTTLSPGAPALTPAKTFNEAWQRGQQDLRERGLR